MPEYTICKTSFSDKRAELEPLIRAHCREVQRIKPMQLGNIDWDVFMRMEQSDCLLTMIAYRGTEIVGYSVSVLAPNSQAHGLKYLQNEGLYVIPECRGGMLGPRLITETEKEAQAAGAHVVVWAAKAGTLLEELLPMMGYELDDVVFAKELEHGLG